MSGFLVVAELENGCAPLEGPFLSLAGAREACRLMYSLDSLRGPCDPYSVLDVATGRLLCGVTPEGAWEAS